MFNNFLQGCIHSQLAKMMHTEKYVLLSVKLPTEGILRVLFENLLLGLILKGSVQFSSVTQSCPTLCDHMNCSTPGPASITSSWSSLRLMSIKLVMPSRHLILCHPLLLLPPISPSIRVFSNESTLCMRWPKY